jgi:hypothetical protein
VLTANVTQYSYASLLRGIIYVFTTKATDFWQHFLLRAGLLFGSTAKVDYLKAVGQGR